MLALELARRQRGLRPHDKRTEDLYIFSPQMIEELQIQAFVHQVIKETFSLRPTLRYSLLPIMLLVFPANANDAPWAPRLMRLAHLLFALPVEIARADAAYFTKVILTFIMAVLGAVPKVVFNPRKAGKKGVATLQWAANTRKEQGERG